MAIKAAPKENRKSKQQEQNLEALRARWAKKDGTSSFSSSVDGSQKTRKYGGEVPEVSQGVELPGHGKKTPPNMRDSMRPLTSSKPAQEVENIAPRFCRDKELCGAKNVA